MTKKTVVVALSGGVDSAVAALLLKSRGYKVIGLFMKNWEDLDGSCPASHDLEDVAKVCSQIKIPFYTVNFTKEYNELVFQKFLSDCKDGLTPNPDILCNREIKFHHFYNKAKDFGDFLATGHYCQIISENQKKILAKGIDSDKDQSYFLYAISPSVLENTLFPLGKLTKKQVREIAKNYALTNHNKKDSTGICFIGKRKFPPFLRKYLGDTPGDILTVDKQIAGSHRGLAYFTIGQRKGMNIGGPGEAWFVVDKDLKNNQLIIAQGKDHPMLYKDTLLAKELNWFKKPVAFPFSCMAKIRYRQKDQPCVIEKVENNCAYVRFPETQRAISAGQSIVFYENMHCLGGGIIN